MNYTAFLLTFFILSVPALALADDLHLAPTSGPSAGSIMFGLGIAESNQKVIYVDHYRSQNGGNNWVKHNFPPEQAVNSIAVHPFQEDTVLLASSYQLYLTTTGGKQWNKVAELGNEEDVISALLFLENSAFAGTTSGKLFFSADTGRTWASVPLAADSPISRIAANPESPQELYVATGSWYLSSLAGRPKTGNGLFKSIDSGKAFQAIEAEFSRYLVQDVDVQGETIYVTTRSNPDQAGDWEGIFKSEDSGKTWNKILDDRTSPFRFDGLTHLVINPSHPKNIIVSISMGPDSEQGEIIFLLSKDGGTTWHKVTTENSEPIQYTHELFFAKNGKVFAQDYYRPFMRSDNEGQNWQWSSQGIRESRVHSLEIHPTNRNIVLAGTTDGALHRTFDGGTVWERIATKLSSTYISSMEFYPNTTEMFLYGVSSVTDQQTGRHFGAPGEDTGLYEASDNGKNIRKLGSLPARLIPLNRNFVSEDAQLEVYDILIHPVDRNILLVATASDGIFRSEDGGTTWQEANTGIPQEGLYWNVNFDGPETSETEQRCREEGAQYSNACFYYATKTSMSLFVNPHDTNEIWYTTLEGIFVSHDIGKSWQWLSDDLKNIHTHYMAFDPEDKNTIYVGTHQGAIDSRGEVIDSSRGLLISRDGGRTWKEVDGTSPGRGRDIRAIAVSSKNPDFVAVGTDEDFYVSEDKGRQWKRIKLETVSGVDHIKIDETATVIYLGTGTSGVWRGIISPENEATISITGVSLPETTQLAKEPFNAVIVVSVDNTGRKEGDMLIEAQIGEKYSSKNVQLKGLEQGMVFMGFKLKEAGRHTVMVNGKEYGNIDVQGEPAVVEGEVETTPAPTIREKQEATAPERNILFWSIALVITLLVTSVVAVKVYRLAAPHYGWKAVVALIVILALLFFLFSPFFYQGFTWIYPEGFPLR